MFPGFLVLLYTALIANAEPPSQPCSSSMMDLTSECSPRKSNHTFFSSEQGNLPQGTYILPGCQSVIQFAEYLEARPELLVTHLLISDSTILDQDTNYGYRATNVSGSDYDNDAYFYGAPHKPPLTDQEEDELEDVRHHNAKLGLKLNRCARDASAATGRILDRVAPSLKVLSHLTYMDQWPDVQLASLLAHDYPRLTHLTHRRVSGQAPSALQSLFLHLPALTHLHLVSYYESPNLTSFRQSSPSLTHVRLTGGSLPLELNPRYVPRTLLDRLRDMAWYPPYKELPRYASPRY